MLCSSGKHLGFLFSPAGTSAQQTRAGVGWGGVSAGQVGSGGGAWSSGGNTPGPAAFTSPRPTLMRWSSCQTGPLVWEGAARWAPGSAPTCPPPSLRPPWALSWARGPLHRDMFVPFESQVTSTRKNSQKGFYPSERLNTEGSLVLSGLSPLWHGFDPWPRNFCMSWV